MYLIAEIGTNHNGNSETAFKLVNAAIEAGVQAVKMNYWKADLLVSKDSDWYQRCKDLELSYEVLKKCSIICQSAGIDFIIAPWSAQLVEESVEIADKLKVASGELTNDGLLQAIEITGISSIISTGMATMKEISHAIDLLEPDIIMHCVSLYPCPMDKVNIKRIDTLRRDYGDMYHIGYSSHSYYYLDKVVAYIKGALAIEFHFNIPNNKCFDNEISLLSDDVKMLFDMLNSIDKMYEKSDGSDFYMKEKLRRDPETGLRK